MRPVSRKNHSRDIAEKLSPRAITVSARRRIVQGVLTPTVSTRRWRCPACGYRFKSDVPHAKCPSATDCIACPEEL